MNPIQKFLSKYNISAHSFTATIGAAFLIYTTDPDVQKFVNDSVAGHPKITRILALAVLLYARYASARSTDTPAVERRQGDRRETPKENDKPV